MMTKRKRQKITSIAARHLLLCSLVAATAAGAFSEIGTPHYRRTTQKGLYSTKLPDPSPSFKKIEEESNFWRSIVRRGDAQKDNDKRIPCDPSLDAEGPLPVGAYQILGKEEYEPKPTCRLSIAVDTASSEEPDLSRLHRFIDCGLSTFQLKDENEEVMCRKLRADTPETVLRACHFVVPFKTPSTSVMAQPSVVRDNVLQSLRRTGGDCIDSIQLECTSTGKGCFCVIAFFVL